MKFYNSNIGRAKLRRDNLVNKSNTKQFKQKSLTKSIISQRVGGITADNIDRECERIAGLIKVDDLLAQIMYHIRFYKDVRPVSFDEDMVEEVAFKIRDLQVRYQAGQIEIGEYINGMESIDQGIINLIDNWDKSL